MPVLNLRVSNAEIGTQSEHRSNEPLHLVTLICADDSTVSAGTGDLGHLTVFKIAMEVRR